MRQTIYKIALAGLLIAGAETSSVAAPALSLAAVVKNAAAPSLTTVGCELTGWDWTGGGIRGALWPGILAVGGYYNSISYGYSGVRPYYGTRQPYAYSCVYAYPVQYVPTRYAHKRHLHRVTAPHVQ
ncbi:MAG: hypothetical protein JO289_01580 [Xanthobacteraceae bacterium]|nr:hypothetical protein [Xanthobacteraceae bacterium]